MKALIGKTVFITGASSGIGAALARAYARRGAHVVLTGRRQDRLDALANEIASYNRKVLVFAVDVSKDGDLEQAVAQTLTQLPSIDYVFANAGFGVAGHAETLQLGDYRRQFETNVFGVLRTFYATLEPLKRSRGHFVVIGSANGYLSLPGNSPYGMSKHAVRALSDSLFHELKPLGIRVTHISPGFIDSEIRRVNNAGEFLLNAKDPIPKWLMASPESAARTIQRAVDRGVRECAVTFHGWAVIRLVRHFPLLTQKLIEWLGVSSRKQPY
jgi:short-subunit dehydrogenase